MAEDSPSTPGMRGVVLNVDDIERLVRAFGQIAPTPPEGTQLRAGNCGVIVCGNGAALA